MSSSTEVCGDGPGGLSAAVFLPFASFLNFFFRSFFSVFLRLFSFFSFFFLFFFSLSSELLLELELLEEEDDDDRDFFFRLPFFSELSDRCRFLFEVPLALESDRDLALLLLDVSPLTLFLLLLLFSRSESELLLLVLELLDSDDEDEDEERGLCLRLPLLSELSDILLFLASFLALDSDLDLDRLSEVSDDFLLPSDSDLVLFLAAAFSRFLDLSSSEEEQLEEEEDDLLRRFFFLLDPILDSSI